MKPSRVAYVLAKYPSLSEAFIRREIEAVRRHGISIDIYALRKGPGADEGQRDTVYRADLLAGEKLAGAAWAALRPLKAAKAVWRIIAEEIARPTELLKSMRNLPAAAAFARRIRAGGVDCIHAHFAGEPAAVARTISLLTGLPYTFSVHARDIFLDNSGLPGRIGRARAVAACTQAAARRAAELVPPALRPRIHLVRHGLMPESLQQSKAEGDREPAVLMVGRLVEKKGVPVLIEALSLLHAGGRAPACVILGSGPEQGEIERAIDTHGLQGLVKISGWVSPGEVLERMSRASVLAVPSVVASDGDRDGLPNVILEAAAARLPVVASDVGGIGEFVVNEVTGLLVPADDAPALAAAIRRLMDDPPLREKLADGASRKLAEEYDAFKNAGKLIDAMGWRGRTAAD